MIQKLCCTLFILVLLNVYTIECVESEYDGPVRIALFHSTNVGLEPEWVERGEIIIRNVVTGELAAVQKPLSAASANELISLAKSDGFYRLKSVVRTSTGKEVSFLSFMKACLLSESQLSDAITVSLDYAGAVVAVSLSPTISVCEGSSFAANDLLSFNSHVHFKHIEQGPTPDTTAYIQKLEREREARDRGEVKDNRSFLAKYWMYIVPVVIFVVLSGASNPEGAPAR